MKDVRITPISDDSVTVQVTCDCGNSAMRRSGQDREFSHHVQIDSPTYYDFILICVCEKKFHVANQRTHIHVREE